MSEKIVHQGRSVKRIREILGKKQEELAVELGITQQAVSLLEGKEIIDPKMLEDVAKALRVTPDAIKSFNEEAAINIISSTLHDNAGSVFYNPTFNPLDKVVELYERMLKEKDEIIAKLRQG
jgi:transcriptional regulator with XRE-family HTH domain